jgi:hypothetical protein
LSLLYRPSELWAGMSPAARYMHFDMLARSIALEELLAEQEAVALHQLATAAFDVPSADVPSVEFLQARLATVRNLRQTILNERDRYRPKE